MRGTFRDETQAERLAAAERNVLRGISPRLSGVVKRLPASRFIILALLMCDVKETFPR
jgi:hypothetical protein